MITFVIFKKIKIEKLNSRTSLKIYPNATLLISFSSKKNFLNLDYLGFKILKMPTRNSCKKIAVQ